MFISYENVDTTASFDATFEISCVNIIAGDVTVDLSPFVSPLSRFHFL